MSASAELSASGVSASRARIGHTAAKIVGVPILAALAVSLGGCLTNTQLFEASTYAQAITAGSGTTCIQRTSGTVVCYGLAVGDGSMNQDIHTEAYSPDGPEPDSQKNALGQVMSLAAGKQNNAVCAVRTTGDIVCWGWQWLVGGNQLPRTVVVVPGVTSARSVSVGSFNPSSSAPTGCAVLDDKTVSCWTLERETAGAPQTVAGLADVNAVSVGNGHACALRDDRSVWCWGANGSGQLGTGDKLDRSAPTQISGLQALSISAGSLHTCAVRVDGAVLCWGSCVYGAIGIPEPITGCDVGLSPLVVEGASPARSVSAGRDFTCAVMTDDTVKCWGENKKGQLGIDPAIVMKTHIPTTVPNLGTAIFVSAASNHACASSRVRAVRCWGENTFGQLTDGTVQNSFTPVPP
jgi:alpha-tubulin suppressor-like RCC1 family protein